MTLGGVVMVVNGTPIYANKVLRRVLPTLRQYAREYDPYEFEINARAEIEKEIDNLRRDEIEVAAAEQSLDAKQIGIAKALTMQWRQKQIAESGGSEQVARARAEQAQPGEDFQDIEDDQYSIFLWMVYKAFKIDPDIQFTAEDEREFYTSHMDEFTIPSKATIILIQADPNHRGGDVGAKGRLQDMRQRALNGEDFVAYARNDNDLPGASGPQGTGGLLADIKPNSLVFTKVDAEIWKVPVGQLSSIIQDTGGYYLFKLVSRETGQTRAFADAAVQEYIKRRLSSLKFDQQRRAEIEKLNEQGIANVPDPNMIDVAVEMAKQNYPVWRNAKSEATTRPENRIPNDESSTHTQ
jgi:parvulin-like peptidyl-prolyl isomerase